MEQKMRDGIAINILRQINDAETFEEKVSLRKKFIELMNENLETKKEEIKNNC